jgi:sulfide:quinone oxidoreductase
MLHDHLTERGARDRVDITVVTPLDIPIPVSRDTSNAILAGFAERRMTFVGQDAVTEIDPQRKVAHLRSGATMPYDLFLAVPIHRVPPVLDATGLTKDGWVDVEPASLRTGFPGVYALGDCANAPVPRAGVFAETAARAVADDILATLHGGRADPYDGSGSCYIEFGGGRIARVDATFITASGPRAPFTPPSFELAREKEHFRTGRLRRWFGQAG